MMLSPHLHIIELILVNTKETSGHTLICRSLAEVATSGLRKVGSYAQLRSGAYGGRPYHERYLIGW